MKIDTEIFSEAFHTALRKCCDSKPTSLMWQIIHTGDNEAWAAWCDHMKKVLVGKEFSDLAMVAATARKINADMNPWSVARKEDRHDTHDWIGALWVIKLAGEIMDEEDWKGACSLLIDD